MKVIHLLANNIRVWADFLNKTEYYVNAYTSVKELEKSIVRFNARDVLGFILYPDFISEEFVRFLDRISESYMTKMPVIIITEPNEKFISQLSGRYPTLDIYHVEAEDNTISDLDIKNSIVLLLAYNDNIYPVFDVRPKRISLRNEGIPDEAKYVLDILRKGDIHEIRKAEEKE